MRLAARLHALERKRALVAEPFRVICARVGKPLSLATSKCTRTRYADGSLMEVVALDGTDTDLSPEELEKFIASFPIESFRHDTR